MREGASSAVRLDVSYTPGDANLEKSAKTVSQSKQVRSFRPSLKVVVARLLPDLFLSFFLQPRNHINTQATPETTRTMAVF